jgi:glycine/D-amino acid oxidase-like deaminating enzyme
LDGGYTLAQGEFHEFYIGRDAFRHFGRFAPILARDIMRTRLLPTAPRGYPDAWGTPRKWNADEQSPFERQRVLNPQPNRGRMRAIQRSFQDRFPSLGAVTLQQAWAGMIDVTPDDIPILDEVPGLPGLILATGMCGHGFGIGPAMGKALANMASGQPTGHDMTPFRFDRF